MSNMENKIDWNRRDYWNEYDLYDEYFLSFHFDHAGVDEFGWNELVKKCGLSTLVTTNMTGEDVLIYNDDYSVVITGNNCEEISDYYIMLAFSKNVDMLKCIAFLETLITSWIMKNLCQDRELPVNIPVIQKK